MRGGDPYPPLLLNLTIFRQTLESMIFRDQLEEVDEADP